MKDVYVHCILIFVIALLWRIFLEPIPFYTAGAIDVHSVSFDGYLDVAENVLRGNGLTMTDAPLPDSGRGPIYPLFIAGVLWVFGSVKALFLVQAALGSAAAVVSYFIARHFLAAKWALAVGLAVALEPYTAYVSGVIFSESVFMILFLPAILLLLHHLEERSVSKLATASILLGLAMLVRPIIQFLPFALLAVFWLHHKSFSRIFFKDAAVLFCGVLLIVTPWLVRNYIVFGTVQFSDSAVKNYYGFLAPSTIAVDEGISYEEAAQPFFAKYGPIPDPISAERGKEMTKIATMTIAERPLGFVKLIGVTQWAFFMNTAYASMLMNHGFRVDVTRPPLSTIFTAPKDALTYFQKVATTSAIIPIGGMFVRIAITFFMLGGILLWILRRGLTPAFALIAGLIAYFALLTSVDGLAVNGRFRVPVDTFILTTALYALYSMFQKRPDGDKPIP